MSSKRKNMSSKRKKLVTKKDQLNLGIFKMSGNLFNHQVVMRTLPSPIAKTPFLIDMRYPILRYHLSLSQDQIHFSSFRLNRAENCPMHGPTPRVGLTYMKEGMAKIK